jgi:ribosomal protein S18 acetylase RimI-like enzyme
MEVVRLRKDQLAEASVILARAFQDDPAWSWVLPNARRREALLPWLFRVGFEITQAEVWTTRRGIVGCARWLPPGPPHVHIGPMLRALVATPMRVREGTTRFLAYGRAVEAMRAETVPEAHWYLAGIGVDPSVQRRGVGGALLRPGLDAADKARLPAALLTNSERNLSFYERHGFEVIHEGETPENGPHAWMMRREPQ